MIRGTGVSSDGRTAGITLPSVHGQIQALKMAYANAGLDPSETFYVEAHGERKTLKAVKSYCTKFF